VTPDRKVTRDSLDRQDSLVRTESKDLKAVLVLTDHAALRDSKARTVSLDRLDLPDLLDLSDRPD